MWLMPDIWWLYQYIRLFNLLFKCFTYYWFDLFLIRVCVIPIYVFSASFSLFFLSPKMQFFPFLCEFTFALFLLSCQNKSSVLLRSDRQLIFLSTAVLSFWLLKIKEHIFYARTYNCATYAILQYFYRELDKWWTEPIDLATN